MTIWFKRYYVIHFKIMGSTMPLFTSSERITDVFSSSNTSPFSVSRTSLHIFFSDHFWQFMKTRSSISQEKVSMYSYFFRLPLAP